MYVCICMHRFCVHMYSCICVYDVLPAIAMKRATISATIHACAALKGDGSVVAWGDAGRGGDSSVVHADLLDQPICEGKCSRSTRPTVPLQQ